MLKLHILEGDKHKKITVFALFHSFSRAGNGQCAMPMVRRRLQMDGRFGSSAFPALCAWLRSRRSHSRWCHCRAHCVALASVAGAGLAARSCETALLWPAHAASHSAVMPFWERQRNKCQTEKGKGND